MESIKQFKAGKTYKTEFGTCGANEEINYLSFKVAKRTEKTVTLKGHFINQVNEKTLRVKVINGVECVLPFGSYSFAPVLEAK